MVAVNLIKLCASSAYSESPRYQNDLDFNREDAENAEDAQRTN